MRRQRGWLGEAALTGLGESGLRPSVKRAAPLVIRAQEDMLVKHF